MATIRTWELSSSWGPCCAGLRGWWWEGDIWFLGPCLLLSRSARHGETCKERGSKAYGVCQASSDTEQVHWPRSLTPLAQPPVPLWGPSLMPSSNRHHFLDAVSPNSMRGGSWDGVPTRGIGVVAPTP